MGIIIDKSKLTIRRPEGCPEWAEIGVMVMVRNNNISPWEGPYPLDGVTRGMFVIDGIRFPDAKPYIKWQPESGEWVAFFDSPMSNFFIGQFRQLVGGQYERIGGGYYTYIARLVDDDGNLIDLCCSVEELKARTEWM